MFFYVCINIILKLTKLKSFKYHKPHKNCSHIIPVYLLFRIYSHRRQTLMYIFLVLFSWGGCVVVMVPSDGAEGFVRSIRDQYYSNRETCGKRIDELVFATSPSEGACCVHVKPTSISDKITDQLPALVHL